MICEGSFINQLAHAYPFGYNALVYSVLRTDEFDEWLSRLGDAKGKARIVARISRPNSEIWVMLNPSAKASAWAGIQGIFHAAAEAVGDLADGWR